MNSSVFDNIESTTWHCFKCSTPAQDLFTYHSYNLPTSNSFNPVLSIPSDCDLVFSPGSVSVSSPQVPVRHSSPQTSDHRHPSNIYEISRITSRSSSHVPVQGKKPYNSLRIAVMNVNSIRNRKAECTEYVKPDLSIFTETMIDASIANSEFLPQEYVNSCPKYTLVTSR